MEGLKMKTQLNIFTKSAITAIFVGLFQAITISATLAATITSTASGNWGNTLTWAGGVVPGIGDDVEILEGHSIEVNDARTVSSISIETNVEYYTSLDILSAGSVTVSNNFNLTSNDVAMEIRINVNGTLVINGNLNFMSLASADARLNLFTGANVTLSGSVVNSTQGQILGYSTNESNFTYAGSLSQTIPLHAGMRYYNLIINKSGANAATLGANVTATNVYNNIIIEEGRLSNGTRTITGNSGKTFNVEDGGTYVLTGTTTLPATFVHGFQSGSTVIYSSASAQTIGVPNAGNYHNIVFEGSGTKTLAGTITVAGNLNLLAGTLDASVSNNNILLSGNWNNTGATFNARNATVTFNGSNAQSITSNANSFYNVVFNNAANGASAIVLNDDVTISNTATMTDGIVNSGANMLVLSSTTAANLSGFSSASYVNGNLRRYITTNTSTYAFPVGTSAYQRIDVKNNNMTGVTYIDGKFGLMERHDDADFAPVGINDGAADYLSLSLSGMWTLDPNSEPGGGTYDILAYTANISGVLDNQFAVVKRATNAANGTLWNTGGGTINASGVAGRLASHGYALRMGLTTFSEFGIASQQPSDPLPVQLVSFNAKMVRTGSVEIKWVTATEVNNDFFSVERSGNGVNFEEILIVNGAGNANRTLNYQTIDGKPLTGVSYYRLAQTDFDGTKSYSNIVSVNNAGVLVNNAWTVFPNPVTIGGNVNIFGNANALNKATVEIFEVATGRKIAFENINAESTKISISNELNPGIYLVRIIENETVQTQKLIVQ